MTDHEEPTPARLRARAVEAENAAADEIGRLRAALSAAEAKAAEAGRRCAGLEAERAEARRFLGLLVDPDEPDDGRAVDHALSALENARSWERSVLRCERTLKELAAKYAAALDRKANAESHNTRLRGRLVHARLDAAGIPTPPPPPDLRDARIAALEGALIESRSALLVVRRWMDSAGFSHRCREWDDSTRALDKIDAALASAPEAARGTEGKA